MRGFTLIELLVVVAIVVLLIAILLPSLANARHQSRRVVCVSNLKQIGAAWEMYLHDSNDRFLRVTNNETNYGGRQGAGSSSFRKPKPLNPYLKLDRVVYAGAEIFCCPSDAGFSSIRPSAFQWYGTSYYPNRVFIGQNQWDTQCFDPEGKPDPCQKAPYYLWTELNKIMPSLRRSVVDEPSRVIFMGDFSWKRTWDRTTNPPDFTYWHRVPYNHNIAFFDGHVDFVPIKKSIHVTPRYTLLPTKPLRAIALASQVEIPPPAK